MVLASTNMGGAEMFVLNMLRNIDFERFHVDVAVCFEETGTGVGKEIISLGCKIYKLPYFRVYNYLSYKRAWKSFLKNNHYDIVHGHMSNSASVYLRIAKKMGSATIAHSHSTGFRGNFMQKSIKKLFTINVGKVSDYWFACSPKAAEHLFGKSFVSYKNYYTIPNAINAEAYYFNENIARQIRKSIGVKDDEFLCGHVGSFTSPKNHSYLMEIFHALLKIRPNSKLLCCGDGVLMQSIKEKAASLGIIDRIVFSGVVHNCNEYMMGMDAFVFPSIYEGFGIAILEAEATGLPVVMSDAIPKDVILTDNVSQLSLNDNPNVWAKKIAGIAVKNRESYNKFVADSKYNMRTSVDMIMSLYDEITNS